MNARARMSNPTTIKTLLRLPLAGECKSFNNAIKSSVNGMCYPPLASDPSGIRNLRSCELEMHGCWKVIGWLLMTE